MESHLGRNVAVLLLCVSDPVSIVLASLPAHVLAFFVLLLRWQKSIEGDSRHGRENVASQKR